MYRSATARTRSGFKRPSTNSSNILTFSGRQPSIGILQNRVVLLIKPFFRQKQSTTESKTDYFQKQRKTQITVTLSLSHQFHSFSCADEVDAEVPKEPPTTDCRWAQKQNGESDAGPAERQGHKGLCIGPKKIKHNYFQYIIFFIFSSRQTFHCINKFIFCRKILN